MSKSIISILIFTIFLLQYQLWFGESGILRMLNLHKVYENQYNINKKIESENQDLYLDFVNLKQDKLLIEEIARKDLGYIKNGEIFYQIISKTN